MNVTNLRAFWAVAKMGSFQKAAHFLALSQPTISREIKALEERYSVILLNRTVRGCTLTKEGEKLYSHALQVFEILEQAERELISDPIGTIRFHAVRHALTAEIIAYLKSILPKVQVEVTMNCSVAIQKSLEAGQCDLALLTMGGVDRSRLDFFEVAGGDVLVYAPNGHPLHQHEKLSIESLAQFPIVTGSKEGQARLKIEELAATHGFHLSVLQEIGPIEAIKAIAIQANAVGVFSNDGYQETRCANTRRLAAENATIPVHLATPKGTLLGSQASLIWRPVQQRFGLPR